jgi:hypothetical protein
MLSSKVVHFVFKGCSSDRSSRLRIGKALISNLAEVGRPHNLLRHHQVVVLGPIYSLLALDTSDSILRALYTGANVADGSYASDTRGSVLISKLLDSSRPVGVFS